MATDQKHRFAELAEATRVGFCVRLETYLLPLFRSKERRPQPERSDQGFDPGRDLLEFRERANEPGVIKAPILPVSHPKRYLECESAMEADDFALLDRGRQVRNEEFRALAMRAKACGWTSDEVGAALISLARRYVAARTHGTAGVKAAGDKG